MPTGKSNFIVRGTHDPGRTLILRNDSRSTVFLKVRPLVNLKKLTDDLELNDNSTKHLKQNFLAFTTWVAITSDHWSIDKILLRSMMQKSTIYISSLEKATPGS